jgi:hypothetical protein
MDENVDLLADSHNILYRWKNYFSVHNVHNASDVTQIEEHAAQPLVIDASPLDGKIAISKLKSINCQVVIKLRRNRFKQQVKYYRMRSINL